MRRRCPPLLWSSVKAGVIDADAAGARMTAAKPTARVIRTRRVITLIPRHQSLPRLASAILGRCHTQV